MPKVHQGRPATNAAASYPVGLLPAPAPKADEPSEETAPQDLPPPAASASRAVWVEYAKALGIVVTAGTTKAQIRKAVA